MSLVFNIFGFIIDLIYNKKCLICGCSKTDDFLCKTCAKDVNYLSSFPHRIYREIPIFSCALYENIIKKLIHMLKFQHRKNSAIVLSSILFKYFKKLELDKNYIIVYPPSFFLKSSHRGYEHMFLIAKEFSKLTNFEIEKNLIKKIKYTKPQYKARNRQSNIKNSFDINKKLIEKYQDKNILLIDDITTSGATLEELINLLIENNIKNITCLTISKTK